MFCVNHRYTSFLVGLFYILPIMGMSDEACFFSFDNKDREWEKKLMTLSFAHLISKEQGTHRILDCIENRRYYALYPVGDITYTGQMAHAFSPCILNIYCYIEPNKAQYGMFDAFFDHTDQCVKKTRSFLLVRNCGSIENLEKDWIIIPPHAIFAQILIKSVTTEQCNQNIRNYLCETVKEIGTKFTTLNVGS